MLKKETLRGYQLVDKYDITILIHKCEGRMFLTDRNGYYTDLLAAHYLDTGGQVLIFLIANTTKTLDTELYNQDVTTMATKGD